MRLQFGAYGGLMLQNIELLSSNHDLWLALSIPQILNLEVLMFH